jgi:hypothetical protein
VLAYWRMLLENPPVGAEDKVTHNVEATEVSAVLSGSSGLEWLFIRCSK